MDVIMQLAQLEKSCMGSDAWSGRTVAETFAYTYNRFLIIYESGNMAYGYGSSKGAAVSPLPQEAGQAREAGAADDNETDGAGYIIFSLVSGEAELLRIGTAPHLRKKGYALLLMDFLIRVLRADNAERLLLEVRSENSPAIELYKKSGFEMIGKRKNYYHDPEDDALIMVKRLSDAGGK